MPRPVHARTTVKSNLEESKTAKNGGVPAISVINATCVQAKEKTPQKSACQTCSFKPFHSIERDLAARAVGLYTESASVVGVSLFRLITRTPCGAGSELRR